MHTQALMSIHLHFGCLGAVLPVEKKSLSSYKVGHLQLQPIIKWKWYIRDQDQGGPEDIRKIHEEMANFQWFLLLIQCLLLSSIHL